MVAITGQQVISTAANNKVGVQLLAQVTDDTYAFVGATVSWGDGTTTAIPRQPKPMFVDLNHVYNIGNYLISITANNYAVPAADVFTVSLPVTFYQTPTGLAPVPVQETAFTYIGPIIPRDDGNPNAADWGWNLATDNLLVASSLKVLLQTNKGEYLMDANYGANLRSLVFSPNDTALVDATKADVSSSVTLYEPRANLQNFNVTAQEGNTAQVAAVFTSNLSPGVIPVSFTITQ